MKYYKLKKGEYPKNKKQNTPNEYFFNGWSVKQEDEKFFLSYISGSLQGELKTIEIRESDFLLAKNGKITISELCIKYDVY